jgi:hypothetical protein
VPRLVEVREGDDPSAAADDELLAAHGVIDFEDFKVAMGP